MFIQMLPIFLIVFPQKCIPKSQMIQLQSFQRPQTKLKPEEGLNTKTPKLLLLSEMQQKVESYDTPPPNYNLNQHATNGFSHRPSLAQIAAYLIISLSIAVYFSSTLPLNFSAVLLVLYLIFGLVMVVSAGMATVIDPTDRVVYYYKWSRHDRKISFAPEYDKVLFCEFCDSYCWSTSKHCRTCNRCVNNFDHHCMWFNNCVGARNYWQFFVSIIATFAYSLVVALHVALASFRVDFGDSGQLVKIVFSWIVAGALAVFGFLIVNLIILHVYLLATGQTTYQFLQRKKKEEEEQKKAKQRQKEEELSLQNVRKQSSSSFSSNQVHPIKNQSPPNKPSDILSDQTVSNIANTKIICVQNEKLQSREYLETRRRGKRKVSNDYFEEQMAKHVRQKSDDKSADCIQEENHQENQEQNVTVIQEEEPNLDESKEKLPDFLRKNKSIKLLLSSTHAQRPSKKKLEPFPT